MIVPRRVTPWGAATFAVAVGVSLREIERRSPQQKAKSAPFPDLFRENLAANIALFSEAPNVRTDGTGTRVLSRADVSCLEALQEIFQKAADTDLFDYLIP